MKRAVTGGAHRGPVAHTRQRRTIRLMQILLAIVAAGLFMFGGYSWGESAGYDRGRRASEIGAPGRPGAGQVIVPVVLGGVALAAAWMLGGRDGARVPTPARLDEFSARAEAAAVERAERLAARSSHPSSRR
jgi:TRAP-type C4-dicarboxylate transport system permease small subunit